MKMLGSLCLVFCLAAVAMGDDKKDDKFDPDKLVGEWTILSGTRSGEAVPKDRLKAKITFDKETVTIPAGQDKFVMAYKIDTKTSPATVDMSIKSGPVNEGKAKGIITMEKGELKLCYTAGSDAKRPTKFESTADNNAFYFVLKKDK